MAFSSHRTFCRPLKIHQLARDTAGMVLGKEHLLMVLCRQHQVDPGVLVQAGAGAKRPGSPAYWRSRAASIGKTPTRRPAHPGGH